VLLFREVVLAPLFDEGSLDFLAGERAPPPRKSVFRTGPTRLRQLHHLPAWIEFEAGEAHRLAEPHEESSPLVSLSVIGGLFELVRNINEQKRTV
jgi:hypothetical protein